MKKFFHTILLITFVENGIKPFVRAAEEDKIVIEYSSQDELRRKLEYIIPKELNEHEEWCKDIVLVPKKKEKNLSNVTTVADPATTSGYLSTPGISTASESYSDTVTRTFSQTTTGLSPSPSDPATTNGNMLTLGISTASESSSYIVTTTFSKATTAPTPSPTVSSVTSVADPATTSGYLPIPGISTASESSSDTVTTTFSQTTTGTSPSPSVSRVTSVPDPATTNGYLSTPGISTASESSSDFVTTMFSKATTALSPYTSGVYRTVYTFPHLQQISDYIRISTVMGTLINFTICIRARPLPGRNLKGTLVSYSAGGKHNAIFLWMKTNKPMLYLNGKKAWYLNQKFSNPLHQCYLISMDSKFISVYFNGSLRSSKPLPGDIGDSIPGNGFLIIGQDQDSVGGGFHRDQAFGGTLENLVIWDRLLSKGEVDKLYRDKCFYPAGAMIKLNDSTAVKRGSVSSINEKC